MTWILARPKKHHCLITARCLLRFRGKKHHDLPDTYCKTTKKAGGKSGRFGKNSGNSSPRRSRRQLQVPDGGETGSMGRCGYGGTNDAERQARRSHAERGNEFILPSGQGRLWPLALIGVVPLRSLADDAPGAAADAGMLAGASEVAQSSPRVLLAAGSRGRGNLTSRNQGALLFHCVGPLLQSYRANSGQSACRGGITFIAR